MLNEKVIKYRNYILILLAILWLCMLFAGICVSLKESSIAYMLYLDTNYQTHKIGYFKWYMLDGWLLSMDGNSVYDGNVLNVKPIYLGLYIGIFIIFILLLLVQWRKTKKSICFLLGLVPFLVTCGFCIYYDSHNFGWVNSFRSIVSGDFSPMLPAIGDWLSAIIALIMFGFSWLCNHWIKQGVSLPTPKERKPREPRKSKSERIAELEKQVEELKRSDSV